MRRSLITAVLILLATALIAHGSTPADDAEAALAAARQRIAELCSQLAKLNDCLQQRDSEIAGLTHRLDATIERQQRAAPLIRDAVHDVLTTARADLAAAAKESVDAGDVLQRAQRAAQAASDDVAGRRAAIERAAREERKTFEVSEGYRRALAGIKAAEDALERERSRLEMSLVDDATLAPLVRAAAKAEADVAAARTADPADDAQLARASAAWISAKNNLATARAAAYVKDHAFAAAGKSLDATNAARTALSDEFDKSVMSHPAVVAAQAAYRDAKDLVVTTESAAATARAALDRAGQIVSFRQDNVNAVKALVEDPDSGLARP